MSKGRTINPVGDEMWEKGIELFGPGFWGTKYTQKHIDKIVKHLGYNARGGSVKNYAKGGSMRKVRYD
jgi:hypothetical protein